MKHEVEHSESVKGITYRFINPDQDIEESVDLFVHHFLAHEPMLQGIGEPTGGDPFVITKLKEVLQQGLSLVAVDEETSQIVGIRTGIVLERSKVSAETPSLSSLRTNLCEPNAILKYIVAEAQGDWINFERHPDVLRIYDMQEMGVHVDWRGRGIAKELIRQAFKVAAKLQCQGAQVLASHDATMHIFESFGMTCMYARAWDEIEVDGKKPFATAKSKGLRGYFVRVTPLN